MSISFIGTFVYGDYFLISEMDLRKNEEDYGKNFLTIIDSVETGLFLFIPLEMPRGEAQSKVKNSYTFSHG